MTVQELIDSLQKIEDKTLPVVMYDCDAGDYDMAETAEPIIIGKTLHYFPNGITSPFGVNDFYLTKEVQCDAVLICKSYSEDIPFPEIDLFTGEIIGDNQNA